MQVSLVGRAHVAFDDSVEYNDNVNSNIQLESTITCPECGHAQRETMPTDACQFFYECTGCHALLRPLKGDCCVFCSFGTVVCPPMQAEKPCCGTPAPPSGSA